MASLLLWSALRGLLLALLCNYVTPSSASLEPDIVHISTGQIKGLRDASNNIRYWLGVPYGANTSAENRFQRPVAPDPWNGVKDCTQYGPGCISIDHNPNVAPTQSEDCLNLDVYVPLHASVQPVPVMFWIYGGSFKEGFSAGPFGMYNASYIASTRGVIVVAINYRLGAFGFLVTDKLQGNYGILDQQLALQWVKTNIAVFGGDSGRVTIWGESAGAMSVGIHLMSPLSKGLFHRAIMESNPLGMQYKTNDRASEYGLDFCALLGCANWLSCDTACIQKAPIANITEAWKKSAGDVLIYILSNWGHIIDGFLEYIPTIDGKVLPEEPIAALEGGRFDTSVPILAGSNTNEGATFVYAGVDKPLAMWEYELAMAFVFGSQAGTVIDYYAQFNFTDGRDALSQVFTDYWFRCASEKFASAAVNHSTSAYVYRYDHLLSASALAVKFGMPAVCATEVCHASELPIVFHKVSIEALNVTLTPEEFKLSDTIVDFWTSFAKAGDPNAHSRLLKNRAAPSWPRWDTVNRPNIVLDVNMSVETSASLCQMWDQVGYNY